MHQLSLDTPSCRFSPAHRNRDISPLKPKTIFPTNHADFRTPQYRSREYPPSHGAAHRVDRSLRDYRRYLCSHSGCQRQSLDSRTVVPSPALVRRCYASDQAWGRCCSGRRCHRNRGSHRCSGCDLARKSYRLCSFAPELFAKMLFRDHTLPGALPPASRMRPVTVLLLSHILPPELALKIPQSRARGWLMSCERRVANSAM